MISARSSLVDVAFEVCTALEAQGVTAVLVGGSAATFYAPQKYQSRDIDFVILFEAQAGNGGAALALLGFKEHGGMYAHSKSPFTVEFPAGPLSVGDQPITQWDTVRKDKQLLHVVTRTDCVRDRLAAFYHWGDAQSLTTAVDVALSGDIDVLLIQEWSRKERQSVKFERFMARLKRKSS